MTDPTMQGVPSLKMQCVPKQRRRRGKQAVEAPPELVDRLEGLLPAEALTRWRALRPRRSPARAGF